MVNDLDFILIVRTFSLHLVEQGWIKDSNIKIKNRIVANIWHRKENKYSDFEIVQPVVDDLRDFQKSQNKMYAELGRFDCRDV